MTGGIEKAPFTPYRLEEERSEDKRTVISVSMNEEELARLKASARSLQQPKDSTALKQLAELGAIVLHEDKMGAALQVVLKNRTKNRRTGAEVDDAKVGRIPP